MKAAFFHKHKKKLITLFALTYPFLAVYVRSFVWWKLDPAYGNLIDINTREMGPFPEFFIYFVPGLALFFLLPIQPRFSLAISVILVGLIYLVAMVWPVYFTSFNAYCSFKGIECRAP
jgi:hypothetical protein